MKRQRLRRGAAAQQRHHLLLLLCIFALRARLAQTLSLHVVASPRQPRTGENGSAIAPFSDVHRARAAFERRCCNLFAAASVAAPAGAPDRAAEDPCHRLIVLMHPGVHLLRGRPLIIGGETHQCGGGIGYPIEVRAVHTTAQEDVIISGGVQLRKWVLLRPGVWSAALPRDAANPKSIRIGRMRAAPARAPAADGSFAVLVAVNATNRTGVFEIEVDASLLPSDWAQWTSAHVLYFPLKSWFSARATVQPIAASVLTSTSSTATARFTLTCSDCPLHPSPAMGLSPGSRVVFYGDVRMLTGSTRSEGRSSGVWSVNNANGTLEVLSAAMPTDVFVPKLPRIMVIQSRHRVTVSGLTFADTDYLSSGTQGSFNDRITASGAPSDAAVAISNSSDVIFSNCTFLALAGGGVRIGNTSTQVVVRESRFVSMGQSGVMFVGNDSTQASNCSVIGNVIVGVGEILAAAAGVFITSASNVLVRGNNISNTSRWGIASRSNRNAASHNIVVEQNRLQHIGLSTADMGAISFIDHTALHEVRGNVIRDNCVRHVVGLATTGNGTVISPHWAHGIYLDDHSSNMVVERNVLVEMLGNGLDMHAGSNNVFANNVIVGGATTMANDTAVAFYDSKHNMTNNTVVRNIVMIQDGDELVLAGRPGAHSMRVERNLYDRYSSAYVGRRNGRSLKIGRLFMNQTWAEWRASGMDNGSVVDLDPGFVGLLSGDFRLNKDAHAHAIGFEPLKMSFC